MGYIIKNNLPADLFQQEELKTRDDALREFHSLCKTLYTKYQTTIFLRDEEEKDLRGSIRVDIDGFFYYVELYKEK